MASLSSYGALLAVIPSHDPSLARLNASFGQTDTTSAWVTLLASADSEIPDGKLAALLQQLHAEGYSSDALQKRKSELTPLIEKSKGYGNFLRGAVLVHEETHFYQLIGTSFGRFLSELDRVFASEVIRLTNSLKIRGPIFKWVQTDGGSEIERGIKALLVMSFTGTLGLKSSLFGNTQLYDLTNKPLFISDVLGLWNFFLLAVDRVENSDDSSDLSIKQKTHPLHLTSGLPDDSPVCPLVDSRPLTPIDILEGAALEIQLTWMRGLHDGLKALPQLLRLVNPSAFNLEYIATRRLVANRIPHADWRTRRSILLILSDIALQGGFYSDQFGHNYQEVVWEDIHPGYRFLRSLDTIAEGDLALTGDVAKDYPLIVAFLEDRLGWRSPSVMMKCLLDAQSKHNAAFTYEDALMPLRLRAARARLSHPSFFADPGLDEAAIHDDFQLIIPFAIDGGRVRLGNQEENLKVLMKAALYSAAVDLYRDGVIRKIFDEPAELRKLIYDPLQKTFFGTDDAGGRQSMENDLPIMEYSSASLEIPRDLQTVFDELAATGHSDLVNLLKYEVKFGGKISEVWYHLQPRLAGEILDLRKFEPTGGFSIERRSLFELIGKNLTILDESFWELLEDVGGDTLISDCKQVSAVLFALRARLDALSPAASRLLLSVNRAFGNSTFDDLGLMMFVSDTFSEGALQELRVGGFVQLLGYEPMGGQGHPNIAISRFKVADDWSLLYAIFAWPEENRNN